VSDAIQDGMGEEIIDELMGALKFNKSLTDGRAAGVPDGVSAIPIVDAGASRMVCQPSRSLTQGRPRQTGVVAEHMPRPRRPWL